MDKLTRTYKTGFGYGQNKGTWKTLDNGKTWQYVADEIMEQVSIGATTVSKNEEGIFVSTPEETVRVFEEPEYKEYKIYAYDNNFFLKGGDELYTSKDGKTYEIEIVGDFTNFDDKKGIYTGPDGVYDIRTKKYTSNRKLIVDGTEDNERINILLTYAINYIFLPEIAYSVTGNTKLKEGDYYLDDLRQQKIALDNESIYHFSEFSSLINWQEDVGMFPFEGITFKDLATSKTIKVGDKTFRLNTDKKLEKAIAHVNAFYENKKNELLMLTANEIKNVEPDKKYMQEISSAEYIDEQEKINALETFTEYIMGAKGAAIEIYNKFVEAVHFLDDYKVRVVINASIYEAARAIAPKLRGRIYDTSKLAAKLGRKQEVPLDDITWNYDKALMSVYVKYQKYINRNIARFSEGGDKNIIRVAALNYRTELRDYFLDELNKKLRAINLYDDLKRHYADKISELNNYVYGSSTEEPNLELPDDFENFYLDRLYLKINYMVNKFNPTFFENDPNYLELTEDERKRAVKYAKEIFDMFKTRICDYYIYMRKNNKLHFTPNNVIKSNYNNWKNGSEQKPSWEFELKRLDVLARDSIVYILMSEEDKI